MKTKQMIKAVCFDFDGVLFESVEVKTQAFKNLFSEYGRSIVRAVEEHHLRNSGMSRYDKLRYYHTELLGQQITDDFIMRRAEEFAFLVKERVIASPWVEGAREFLEFQKGHYLFFVISGTPQDELVEIVGAKEISSYFLEVFGSPSSKEIHLQHILKKWDLLPKQVVFVGDGLSDYLAARTQGIFFVGRRTGKTSVFPAGTLESPDLWNLHEIISTRISNA